MATITVYGASDDLVEIEGVKGADEFYIHKENWTGVIEAPNGDTALLYVDFRDNGCWTSSLGLYEEDYNLPNWPVKITVDPVKGNRYSTYTTIEVPDGTTIREWKN